MIDSTVALFVVNAVIGSLLNVLMWCKSWEELKGWEAVKTVLIGAIVGYIYWWGHQEHGFPDGLMSILVGYSSKDFIEWVMTRIIWKKPEES